MFFSFDREVYEGLKLRKRKTFELKPGISVLVGCNGAGKTTLLNEIRAYCERNEIPCKNVDFLKEGSKHTLFRDEYDISWFATSMICSEGEKTILKLRDVARELGSFCTKNKDADSIFILLDALDSGFSIDNIVAVKEQLFATIMNEFESRGNLYILVSTNDYEFTIGEDCFDVQECKYRRFPTYKVYKNFVIKSREKRDRLEKKEG